MIIDMVLFRGWKPYTSELTNTEKNIIEMRIIKFLEILSFNTKNVQSIIIGNITMEYFLRKVKRRIDTITKKTSVNLILTF